LDIRIAHVLVWFGGERSKNWDYRIGDYLQKLGHEVIRLPYLYWPRPHFDCDFILSTHHAGAPLAMHLAEREKKPLICQVLDIPKFRLSGEEPWASNLKKYLGITLEQYRREWDEIGEALKRAGLVLAISETTANDVEEMFGVKAEVNHLGVDTEIADRCLAGFKQAKRDQFCSLGNLNDHKKFDYLAKVFTKLGRRLIIMGEGYMRGEIERIAGQNVILTGAVTEEQKFRVLSRSLALVHASICEGQPLMFSEALYSGCPVVCYDLPVIHEVYGDQVYYWQDEEELKGLIEKAESLKADRQYVLERGLTLDKYTRRLESMLEALRA